MTSATSTPGSVAATASLIASSSRTPVRSTGAVHHARTSAVAGIRDPPVHMTLLVDAVLLDEPVAFEAFERVVDLADVERPRRAGAPVELGSQQLIAVAGPLIEDRQEAHQRTDIRVSVRPVAVPGI
jgi:hypothetical protein